MLETIEHNNIEEMEVLSKYDPFTDWRRTYRIRRSGSWYEVSAIDMNINPTYDYIVICVHGWGSNSLNYRYMLKFLSPYCRIIAYDLKGHGKSDKAEDTYDLGLFTEELAQIIDIINPKKLILVGHSMGTAIVLNYLYLNPDRAKAAVILSGAANFKEPLPRFVPLILTHMDERVKKLILEIAASFLSSKEVPKELSNMIKEHLIQTPYDVFRKSLLNTVYAWKKDEDLEKIKIPILIMVGDKDPLTPVKQSEQLNKLLPNSRLIIIPNARHSIVMGKGIEVSNLILEFIEYQIDIEKKVKKRKNF